MSYQDKLEILAKEAEKFLEKYQAGIDKFKKDVKNDSVAYAIEWNGFDVAVAEKVMFQFRNAPEFYRNGNPDLSTDVVNVSPASRFYWIKKFMEDKERMLVDRLVEYRYKYRLEDFIEIKVNQCFIKYYRDMLHVIYRMEEEV